MTHYSAGAWEQSSGSDQSTPATQSTKKKRVRIKTARRREQCRANQARYRNKLKAEAIELEDTVESLRLQVVRLQHEHLFLLRLTNARDAACKKALEYFRLFRYGLTLDDQHTSCTTRRRHPLLAEQLAFVNSTFHRDVRTGDDHGRARFIEQNRLFPTVFDDYVIILERTEVRASFEASSSVVASVTLEMTMSNRTIDFVFPHLKRPEHRHIRDKIVGQRLQCMGRGMFVFNEDALVERVQWSFELVKSLQAFLPLHEVAIVVQDARIKQDAYLLSGEVADQFP